MKAYDVPGLSSKKDIDIVYEFAKTVPENGTIVEIGSFFGRTAVAFAEGAYPSVTIYCIDYFNEHTHLSPPSHGQGAIGTDFWQPNKVYNKEEEFTKFTKDYKNIIPLKLEQNLMVYPYDKEPIDLLFLDCAHINPNDLQNIFYFKKFLKPNALICGHDYHESFPDVIYNVRILEKLYKTIVTLYHNSSMWSIRINK